MREPYTTEELQRIVDVAAAGRLGVAGGYPGATTVCIEQAARPGERPRQSHYSVYDAAVHNGKLPRFPNGEEIAVWLLAHGMVRF